jgi:hypothetical protein
MAVAAVLLQSLRLCNNCTGDQANRATNSVAAAVAATRADGGAAPAFTTISGYDGRMQAGSSQKLLLLRQAVRSPAAKKQRYITSNDRYKSRAFSPPLVSQCQKSDIIKETLRYYYIVALAPPGGGL